MTRIDSVPAQQSVTAIRAVATASARELLRNGFVAGVMLFMFLSFIVILALLDLFLTADASNGGAGTHDSLLEQNLGVIAAMGFMSLAFVGTSVPLVTYRDRGTLRLLGTTPLSRTAFLLGQVPVRAAIALTESVVVLALMWSLSGPSAQGVAVAAGTLLVGAAMFLAIGMLVGARGRNVDLTMQISLIAPVVVIATSGVILPLDALPGWLSAALGALPTTWFMTVIDGAETLPVTSVVAAWCGMLAVAAGAFLLAVRIFDWGVEKRG